MPYKKRYRKRTVRPTYMGCGKMVMSDAQKALAIARGVKALLNVEYKSHTVTAAALAITDSASATNLTLLVQGDTDITRDGSQVKFTSLRFGFTLKSNASATRTNVRIMLVHDKQTNQAQATATQVLQDSTPIDAIISAYNIDNVSRFNILYDKVFSLDPSYIPTLSRVVHKKLNLKVRYDANAGDVTDLTQDSIFLIMVSDQVTNDPTISHQIRLRYLDN